MKSIQNMSVKIDLLLKDFTQDKNRNISGIWSDFHKYSIDGEYDENRLIRYIFVKHKQFVVWDQPMEKINWEIVCSYKNIPISFAHQKLGFRIYIDNKLVENAAEAMYREIVHILEKCFFMIEAEVRTEGLQALNRGEVIIVNKLKEIEDTFNFFYIESKKRQEEGESSKSGQYQWRKIQETQFLTDAAYMAFFSFIEHLCVLGLAFSPNVDKVNLNEFTRSQWYEKYKLVFPLQEREVNSYYNKFIDLARYRRNPASHGYLDKINTIFAFYLDDARHRIPMNLYDKRLVLKMGSRESNLDTIVEFLGFLRKHPDIKKWITYLERGFDVSYNRESINELRTYMSLDSKSRKEYLDYQSRLEDDMGNMDW